jgi:cellulose synthase/poly-beta-1,6-N-acetylglucosamine synthase-like glycosyltransferase
LRFKRSPHIKLSLSSWVTLPALSELKLFCHLEYDSYSGRTCWILEDLRKYTADKSLRTVTLSRLRLLLYFAGYPQFMSLSFHQKISSLSLLYLILIFIWWLYSYVFIIMIILGLNYVTILRTKLRKISLFDISILVYFCHIYLMFIFLYIFVYYYVL